MTYRSAPLLDIISKTNKKSNNLYARHIFLLLGAKLYGPPATEAKGRNAVKQILGSRNIIGPGTILDNGCGLSRRSRLTALTLHRLLQDAYRHYGKSWMRTLSVAGKDGTIRKRFRHSIAKGKAWMKTGTLKNAKNIAGYVKGRSGKLYTVVILYNGSRRWLGAKLQNRIIEWLARSR
jgi:D-alanyl-D-alanine carboxypeptidase/D-alanyl-D-alanine-endopeptidase (penicillin-binding protein 4)